MTEAGILGAEQLGSALRNTPWDCIMCSDLPRTRSTLAIIQAHRTLTLHPSVEEQFTAVVREVKFGIREGLPKEVSVEEAKRIWSEKHGGTVESVIDPAESEAEVLIRQRVFLQALRTAAAASLPHHQQQQQQQLQPIRVLCVSHGGFIRRFLSNFTDDVKVDSIPNCSITTLHIVYGAGADAGTTTGTGTGRDCDDFPDSLDVAPTMCRAMDVCIVDHLQSPSLTSSGFAGGGEENSSSSSSSGGGGDIEGDVELNEWSMDSVLLLLVAVLVCVVAMIWVAKSE